MNLQSPSHCYILYWKDLHAIGCELLWLKYIGELVSIKTKNKVVLCGFILLLFGRYLNVVVFYMASLVKFCMKNKGEETTDSQWKSVTPGH